MANGGEDALRAVSEAVRERWRGGRPQGSVGVQPDHGHVDREVGLAVWTAGAASLAASRHLCGRPLKAATGNDENPINWGVIHKKKKLLKKLLKNLLKNFLRFATLGK